MISNETLKIACDLLINLSECGKKVEINRQVLCQNNAFDAYQLFSYLDTDSKNFLNEVNIINFLQEKNGISCTVEEIQFLIFLYDENFDGKLSYTEFLNLVLSDNNYTIRKSARERVGTRYGKSVLPFNVEYSVVKLLKRELDLIRTTWRIIDELKSKNDFNIHELYHHMKGYECITPQSIQLFLQKNLIQFQEEDIRSIMKRLDIDRDNKVNFCEFHSFFCFPNANCTCCAPCGYTCHKVNTNTNSIIGKDYIDIYSANNNNFKSKLNLRLSPERTNKINNIQRSVNSLPPSFRTAPDTSNSFNQRENLTDINVSSPMTNNKKFFHLHQKKNCQNCKNYPGYCNQMELEISENNFLEYISKLIETETKIEEAKKNLVIRPDFNVEDAFRIFENPQNDIISCSDLQNGLKQLGVGASPNEIKFLMRRGDAQRKGHLNFSDFFDLLVPFEKKFRDNVERRLPSSFIPTYNKSDIFLLSTKNCLVNLIGLIITCEEELNLIRENIIGINAQIEKIFDTIDVSGLGFISDMELYIYLKNKGIISNDLQNSLIFIKLDKSRNGKIELWEIQEELSPF